MLQLAYLNSHYQTGLKNLLDVAVLQHVDLHRELAATDYAMVDEMPFDFSRRRMSVVVAERNRCHLLIRKGAVEEVLAVSHACGGTIAPSPRTRPRWAPAHVDKRSERTGPAGGLWWL